MVKEGISRLVGGKALEEDRTEGSLRPRRLSEYVGQDRIKENIKVFMEAARLRGDVLDHVLLSGPPGLGKTTLALCISCEMGVRFLATSGPAIERPIDLLVLLKGLNAGDILFIDEIHRLPRIVEEILYPAMEDFVFDRIIGKGSQARSRRVPLPPFTLIGATTRQSLLTSPLRDRFGISFHLNYYSNEELVSIIKRSASILGIAIKEDGAWEIAKRSRGTPRVANRLLRRVRDFAQVVGSGIIDRYVADMSLHKMGIDSYGLDDVDRKILECLVVKFKGKPVGLETISAFVEEDSENIEQVYEPYLLKMGFISKTPRGRVASPEAFRYWKEVVSSTENKK